MREFDRELDEKFMREAIRLASLAVEHGNEPFGAVLVKDGKIAFESENRIYTMRDRTYHAELGLLRDFFAQTDVEELSEYTLYSSLEPCFMCSGALVWAKLGRLVYGASDRDLADILSTRGSDCVNTVFDAYESAPLVTAGVLREESLVPVRTYFQTHKKN